MAAAKVPVTPSTEMTNCTWRNEAKLELRTAESIQNKTQKPVSREVAEWSNNCKGQKEGRVGHLKEQQLEIFQI